MGSNPAIPTFVMEFYEAVRRRRMVRNYDEGFHPSAEQIGRIVAAAKQAPSAGFTQGQSFVVVSDRSIRRQLAEIVEEASYVNRGFQPWISRAPVHVVLCISPGAYDTRYGEPDKAGTAGAYGRWPVPWWFWDGGASFMALLLAAVNEGLGAGFLAFDMDEQQPVRNLLGIPPDVIPAGVVTIGKPAEDRPSSSLRRGWKPDAEVIHRERWRDP